MAIKKYSCAGRAITRDTRQFVSLDGMLEKTNVKVGVKKSSERFAYIGCSRKYYEHEDVPFCNGATSTGDSNLMDCRCIYADLIR
ncbi:MAG: hypothetical protein OEL87_02645 [Nanoarchaeota archaeon]|nr:hypothetical protein [Nanoarchaeota archaeon]